jgi:DNA processing protein
MTALDAASLSLLALRDRRLVAALIRFENNCATAEDVEALPPRAPGESLVQWGCRSRTREPAASPAEVQRLTDEARRALDHAARLGISAIPITATDYPPLLRAIGDPPPMLWVRGRAPLVPYDAVALVGSRAATPYALGMARRIAGDLALAGVTVVSGLARGVDMAAHSGAVQAGGRTFAVLGCGVDRVYPPEARDLALEIEGDGALISELPPGLPPLRHHFPLRNRLISGLSRAVVVVEAPEKSGALITAAAAAEQGRDVMVVPGQASGRNRGGHLLLADGAKLVEHADDILEEFSTRGTGGPDASGNPGWLPQSIEFSVDEAAEVAGQPTSVVLAMLLELELAGRIRRVGGGQFVRVLT